MIITAWILAIFFGIFTLMLVRHAAIRKINWLETIVLFFSAIVSAVSIGLIHSGSWIAFIS